MTSRQDPHLAFQENLPLTNRSKRLCSNISEHRVGVHRRSEGYRTVGLSAYEVSSDEHAIWVWDCIMPLMSVDALPRSVAKSGEGFE